MANECKMKDIKINSLIVNSTFWPFQFTAINDGHPSSLRCRHHSSLFQTGLFTLFVSQELLAFLTFSILFLTINQLNYTAKLSFPSLNIFHNFYNFSQFSFIWYFFRCMKYFFLRVFLLPLNFILFISIYLFEFYFYTNIKKNHFTPGRK